MALPSSAFVRVVSADSKTNSETVLRLSDGATATDVLTAMGNKQLPRVEPNALAKYSLIMVAAAEARASDPPAKRRYTLRTLAASDRPLELAAERGQQRLSAARASSSAAGRNDSAVRWYFKDTTKAPLRCVVRACSSDRSLTPPPQVRGRQRRLGRRGERGRGRVQAVRPHSPSVRRRRAAVGDASEAVGLGPEPVAKAAVRAGRRPALVRVRPSPQAPTLFISLCASTCGLL